MIKKIFLAAAMFLVTLLALAQTDSGSQNVKIISGDQSLTISKDTLCTIVSGADTVMAIIPTSAIDAQDDSPQIITVNGLSYVTNKGRAYVVDDIFENLDDMRSVAYEEGRDSAKMDKAVPVIAICFIVPCVTIACVLIFILDFFMKKTRARNKIIEKAIDANYTLPDAFYYNGPAPQPVTSPVADAYNTGMEHTPGQNHAFRLTTPASRDPKSFSSAVTLLAVGLSLLLFFGMVNEFAVGCLAGGVLFLLGLGKLLGYFFVPGFTTGRRTNTTYQRTTYSNTPQPPHFDRNHDGYADSNRYPGSYPPPFNPGEPHDNQMPPRQ